MTNVLVPVDGSESATRAVRWGTRVIHVVDVPITLIK